jgi:heat shock protein HslJ
MTSFRRGICFTLGLSTCAASLLFAYFTGLPSAAPACACGDFRGVVVADGASPSGQPWRIKVSRPSVDKAGSRTVEFYFSTGLLDGYEHVGYFKRVALPISKQFVLSANAGSDAVGENDLSGLAGRRAVALVVGLSNGDQVTVAPQLAPERLRRRFPWLQRLRFFDGFLGDASPVWVRALDHRGRQLASRQADRGLFWAVNKRGAPGAPLWDREFVGVSARADNGTAWPPDRARKVHLSFSWPQRWMGWNASCNEVVTKIRLTPSKIKKIGGIISTEIGCLGEPAREDRWLLRLFQADPKWRWGNGRLTVWSDGNVLKLRRIRLGS